MIVSMYNSDAQNNVLHEIPDAIVEELVGMLLNNSAWKYADPETVMERCLKFRKKAFEQAQLVKPVLDEPKANHGKLAVNRKADTDRGPARPALAS